jgi:hypothetical protein
MFSHTITYTHNRNAYIKISSDGTVVFLIPRRYKRDETLLQSLFEKGEKLRTRYQTRPKLEKWNDQGLQLFGEWIPWEET